MKQNNTKRGFIPYALAAFLIGIVGGFSTVLGPAFVQDIGIDYNNTTSVICPPPLPLERPFIYIRLVLTEKCYTCFTRIRKALSALLNPVAIVYTLIYTIAREV